jgi:hypothetical protein
VIIEHFATKVASNGYFATKVAILIVGMRRDGADLPSGVKRPLYSAVFAEDSGDLTGDDRREP